MLSVRTIDRPAEVTLRLEGELMGLEVTELDRIASELLAKRRVLSLDLAAVTWVDDEGIALLRELRASGAVWQNASNFVLCLLEGG
jgi:ABC-type transporter Mla MlaB component